MTASINSRHAGRVGAVLLGGALLGFFVGCQPAASGLGEPGELDHSRFDPIELSSEIVTEADFLALPKEIEVVGPYLAILDAASDSAVTVIRREDGAMVRAFGRRGDGPGEFAGTWSIETVPGDDETFWVYDVGLLRLSRIDLNRVVRGEDPVVEMVRLGAETQVIDPVWLDTMVVGLGFFSSGRLALFDSQGQLLRRVGAEPPGSDDVPVTVRHHVYQSKLKANTSRTRLALATRHTDLVEIYRPDGTLVAAPQPLFGFMPKFEVREQRGMPTMVTGDDLRFGYIDLAATDDRIYALFSGRTRRGYPGFANFGQYVHVFDWHGELNAVYRLDSAAISISVDPSGRTLYAVRHEPHPAVVRYSLPEVQESLRIGSR